MATRNWASGHKDLAHPWRVKGWVAGSPAYASLLWGLESLKTYFITRVWRRYLFTIAARGLWVKHRVWICTCHFDCRILHCQLYLCRTEFLFVQAGVILIVDERCCRSCALRIHGSWKCALVLILLCSSRSTTTTQRCICIQHDRKPIDNTLSLISYNIGL